MIKHDENFFLKGNGVFNDRQKSIFGVLDGLTPDTSKIRYSAEEFRNDASKKTVSPMKKELKHFKGQDSIFKRPEVPAKKRSFKMSLPDFVKNPSKWKRYKMSGDEMTEGSNKAAAMAFLNEIKSRRDENMETDQESTRIMFNKHAVDQAAESEAKLAPTEEEVKNTKTVYLNSKQVMPEYVVGQKVKKKVTFKKPTPAETAATSIKLQHLFDGEEEE